MRESVYVTMVSRELHVKEHNVKMIAVIMDSCRHYYDAAVGVPNDVVVVPHATVVVLVHLVASDHADDTESCFQRLHIHYY